MNNKTWEGALTCDTTLFRVFKYDKELRPRWKEVDGVDVFVIGRDDSAAIRMCATAAGTDPGSEHVVQGGEEEFGSGSQANQPRQTRRTQEETAFVEEEAFGASREDTASYGTVPPCCACSGAPTLILNKETTPTMEEMCAWKHWKGWRCGERGEGRGG